MRLATVWAIFSQTHLVTLLGYEIIHDTSHLPTVLFLAFHL
jgi:hypothetical protein